MNIEQRKVSFLTPEVKFKGKTFWSWNGKLEENELLRQIDIMKEMGFGGYFMHSRTGLETEYLGEEWFHLIRKCTEYGSEKGLESWLYDEDRWPSGSAGGIVTKDTEYRASFLEMNTLSKEEMSTVNYEENVIAIFGCVIEDGKLIKSRRLNKGDVLQDEEQALVFSKIYAECSDNYNGYCYTDTMNKEATKRFIEVTHEKYREHCKNYFGTKIQGIFTDEPHRGPCFTTFSGGAENKVAYTPLLFQEFEDRFHYDLKELLPELFLNNKNKEISKVTWDYFELCQELFIENFAIPIQKWCRENDLKITGHVLHEDCLCSQVTMQGSLMRYYEYMDYPGIDILGEYNECYWVVKQVVSVARQLNKEWVLSELDGCSGWQMSMESYKNIGDWQALFGVNLRCPHLSWYTMKGEAKRDYPASILHQSPWYKDYHYLEDYFSRIHVAMHEGEPQCELLVINPIESVWARSYCGSFSSLGARDEKIKHLEEQYVQTFYFLTGNQIDFDYGDEDIISRHGRVEKGILYVGKAKYRRVLITGMDTIRSSTVKILEEFAKHGGEIIFAGEVPLYMDANLSNEPKELANKTLQIPFHEIDVAKVCRSSLEIEIHIEGQLEKSSNIFTQCKQVEGGKMIMLLNIDRKKGYRNIRLNLGDGAGVERWNPRNGEITPISFEKNYKNIVIETELEAGGERLYFVKEREIQNKDEKQERFIYELNERNICVLDYVEVSLKNGKQLSRQEVLKADRALRDMIEIPYRGGEMLQPWYEVKYRGGDKELIQTLTLEYTIEIDTIPTDVQLVVEELEHINAIDVNGVKLDTRSIGKWIDICFDLLTVPDHVWKTGENIITINLDYYRTSGLEAIYLLGGFGVNLIHGSKPVLVNLPESLVIGDISIQGLPFYSGSILYILPNLEDMMVDVTIFEYGGSLIKLLGEEEQILAFPPYHECIKSLKKLEVVLTRRNTFGPFHQLQKRSVAYGPENFITDGERWTDSYVLYEQGLLQTPRIIIIPTRP